MKKVTNDFYLAFSHRPLESDCCSEQVGLTIERAVLHCVSVMHLTTVILLVSANFPWTVLSKTESPEDLLDGAL